VSADESAITSCLNYDYYIKLSVDRRSRTLPAWGMPALK
jgi:hypothetical protein